MTEHIVGQAKNYESDTIPGDFATLANPCPKCGGEVHEKYKKFQCENPKCDFAFWKIMGGRQIEPQEADALIKERTIGPLEGFRSKMGRPFSAVLKLNDANEVVFDFGNSDAGDDGEAPDFSQADAARQVPEVRHAACSSTACRTCARRRSVRTRPATSARAGRSCSARSSPSRCASCCESKKTDLLQFVSQRTRRPFSAFLVVQKDGKVGFEFEAKDPSKARGTRGRAAALRVLGAHPRTKAPVELHSGRYGPYVKHGNVNATLPDKDQVDAHHARRRAGAARREVRQVAGRPRRPRAARGEEGRAPAGQDGGEDRQPAAKSATAKSAATKPTSKPASKSATQAGDQAGSQEAGREEADGQAQVGGRGRRPRIAVRAQPGRAQRPHDCGSNRRLAATPRSTACAASPSCSCSACTRRATPPSICWHVDLERVEPARRSPIPRSSFSSGCGDRITACSCSSCSRDS